MRTIDLDLERSNKTQRIHDKCYFRQMFQASKETNFTAVCDGQLSTRIVEGTR